MTNVPSEFFLKRSENEAKTHELLDGYTHDVYPYSAHGLKAAFKCQWQASMTADRWVDIASAIFGSDLDGDGVKAVLADMKRKKLIRTYRKQGKVLIEMNY